MVRKCYITNKKADMIIEYAAVIALVVAVLLLMSFYVRRAVCGKWRGSADSFGYGQQYEPGLTEEN